MARALLLALAFAVASGARYVDYSGVKMPQYGGTVDYEGPRDSPAPPEDYLDRPDAPVSLADYKYEEENGELINGDSTLFRRVVENGWSQFLCLCMLR